MDIDTGQGNAYSLWMANTATLLTTGQVASLLEVDRETVRRWCIQGQLDAIRLPSGQLRIRRSEVDRLLSPSVEPDAQPA